MLPDQGQDRFEEDGEAEGEHGLHGWWIRMEGRRGGSAEGRSAGVRVYTQSSLRPSGGATWMVWDTLDLHRTCHVSRSSPLKVASLYEWSCM